MRKRTVGQRGAVALFVVIFSALLVTIVTVSFIQIMLRSQQEATTADLSQSAYDSALAGVEDAKQVLAANADFSSNECTSVATTLGRPSSDEGASIQQKAEDTSLNQAYTCVKVNPKTSSVSGSGLDDSASTLIPLNGTSTFKKIRISWGLHAQSGVNQTPIFPANLTGLPRVSGWDEATPALLRTQLIQYGDSFKLTDFDTTFGSNSRTKFLYPSLIAGLDSSITNTAFSDDSTPTPIKCSVETTPSCSVTFVLPNPQGGGTRHAFLRLSALYNIADYKVELLSADDKIVNFDGVQAQVDSTGRAGDVFRRVSAVLNLKVNNSFPYPEAALDVNGSLCKTFRVTDKPADYDADGCKPYSDDIAN